MVRKSKGITEKHLKVLKFITQYQKDNGRSPSIREIAEEVKISSTSVVNYYLDQLEKLGYVERDNRIIRGIRVIPQKTPRVLQRSFKDQDFDNFQFTLDSIKRKRISNFIRPMIIIGIFTVLLPILIFISLFISQRPYMFPVWTGFSNKSLWDLLELLIVPATLSIGIFILNRSERRNERKYTQERAQEASLQNYLDKMTELMLTHDLRNTEKYSEKSQVARTRTLTVLRGLDGDRKSLIIKFLYEADLIVGNEEDVVIDLIGADLTGVNLSGSDLREINLTGANLYKANFEFSNLRNAIFQGTILNEANFKNGNLVAVDFRSASLDKINFMNSNLDNSNFERTSINIEQLAHVKSKVDLILD